MSPLDCPKAAHHTRVQLSNLMCERALTKEEAILHNVATRFMIRILTECEKRFEEASDEKPNEDPPTISGNGETEVSPS